MIKKLSEIAAYCSSEMVGVDSTVNRVVTDSRSLFPVEGALFVAIKGKNHDGHNYIQELYRRGVRAFIVESRLDIELPDAGFVVVDDAIEALQKFATHYRQEFTGVVVAITGSNGKSVVKEWATDLIGSRKRVFRSPKSYNSQLGVPLSILMMEGNEDVAIIEAGISSYGEMERLERIIRPQIGVITTIGEAHQQNFSTIEDKLNEKLKLFVGVNKIVYNSCYPLIDERLRSFSVEKIDCRKLMDAGNFAEMALKEDCALAIAICDTLGLDHTGTLNNIERLQNVALRLELKEGRNNSLIINDFYNYDVNSLAIALDYLNSVATDREQMVILSDILQSGVDSRELYYRVAKMLEDSKVTHIIGIGREISRCKELFASNAEFYTTTAEALERLTPDKIHGRVILIKGNRKSGFEGVSHFLAQRTHTTTLEIDLDAMIHNLNMFRSKLKPTTKLMAMVKASSYGNGDYQIASMLSHQGVDYLAVAFADEGVKLRQRGITMPIVVLNADEESFDVMIENRLEPEIYNFRSLQMFVSTLRANLEQNYPIHIKLDTGMHRLGFEPKDIENLIDCLRQDSSMVHVASIFSHLATSDDSSEDGFTLSQIELFDRLSSRIADTLPYRVLRHILNSAAIERFSQYQFDMCRLGIGLYGIAVEMENLIPVSRLATRIVQIKEIDPLQSVGYGRAGRVVAQSRIATIPIGYADGIDRHLGEGRWKVLVNGEGAPIVGRICMDTTMIDITLIDGVREGDEVVIFSRKEGNRVEDMAKVLGTIPYEIMTSIADRVKRIFTKE